MGVKGGVVGGCTVKMKDLILLCSSELARSCCARRSGLTLIKFFLRCGGGEILYIPKRKRLFNTTRTVIVVQPDLLTTHNSFLLVVGRCKRVVYLFCKVILSVLFEHAVMCWRSRGFCP